MIDLQRLLRLLAQEEVEAVLVGGAAMILQNVTHFTNDIDVCYLWLCPGAANGGS